jgi:hypothetical protein
MWLLRKCCILAIATACGLAACATPDMTDFAKQSAALRAAVATENSEVAKQYDNTIGLGIQLQQDGVFPRDSRNAKDIADRVEKLNTQRKQVADNAKQVDELMADVSAYTASLANLAAQGETGSEAVEQAFGSLAALTGLASPGGVSIPQPVVEAAKAVGQAFTSAQAQRSLDEAMSEVTRIQGAQKLADVLKAYLQGESLLIVGLRTPRTQFERYKVGSNLIGYYLNYQTWVEARVYPELLTCFRSDSEKCHLSPAVAETLAGAQDLYVEATPHAQSFFQARAEVEAWSNQRQAKIAAISVALDAWAVEHDRFAAYFRQCAGLRVLRVGCGAYSAANLAAAIATIQTILSDLSTTPADPAG